MADLAATLAAPSHDVTYVFYVAEEIARSDSGLLQLDRAPPGLLAGDAAVVCEPTGSAVEAGCQGVIKAEVVLAGTRRMWPGPGWAAMPSTGLAPCAGLARRRHRGGPSWTAASTGNRCKRWGFRAASPLMSFPTGPPSSSTTALPPTWTCTGPRSYARGRFSAPWLEDRDSFEVTDSAPSAPPSLSHPFLAALVEVREGGDGQTGLDRRCFFCRARHSGRQLRPRGTPSWPTPPERWSPGLLELARPSSADCWWAEPGGAVSPFPVRRSRPRSGGPGAQAVPGDKVLQLPSMGGSAPERVQVKAPVVMAWASAASISAGPAAASPGGGEGRGRPNRPAARR